LAPDISDMKALATALKLAAYFNTVDRLARDWIEKGMRGKKPEELEEDEKREWYDLSDCWERAIDALKKKVDKFRQETGYSPILRYWRQADSMGQTGKVYLGYDSAQAKGYRIIEITFPAWFEELNFPTEEKSEEDVYRLVPVERLSPGQERVLRDGYVEDLKEAGIEPLVTRAYIDRYESTIDKRRTYNENVFRVDALVQMIMREHALAVAKPPGELMVPVTAPRARVPTVYTLEQMWGAWGPEGRKTMLSSAGYPYADIDITVNKDWNNLEDAERKAVEKAWRTLEEKEKPLAPPKLKVEVPREVPSEVRVKVKVEEGTNAGEYFVHLFYDSFEAWFLGFLRTQALKDYLAEKEDYVDFRENLSLQDYAEAQVEEELKKLPSPFSSGEEIKLVWTPQDVEFTPTAKEWWDAFNKIYARSELEAFDVERLKTIAKLKGVKVGKDKQEVIANILGEAYTPPVERAKPPTAPTPAPTPPTPERKGLTSSDISKLQDVYSDALFRQLGRVPTNSLATFRVEIDKVRDKTFSEAQDYILGVANDIIGGFVAREGIGRIVPARRFEAPERPEEPVVMMGRVPPAQPPKEPLEPEEMKFPRAPSRKEKEVLWNSFRYRLQEQAFNAFDFTDQFEEYIEKSQFASWWDLLRKFEDFTKSIMEGKLLPPLWSWRGAPIPVGLEGVIRETPAERMDDLIVHFTSVVIRNARSRGVEAALGDLQEELVERGVIPSDMIITPTSPLFDEIKNAVMDAYKRKDDWFTNISLEELSRFLET